MLPQDAVGSAMPSPRKLKEASEMIALAIRSVAYTMIWDTQFGKICKNQSLTGETPTTRQALQYSSSFTIRT